MELKQHDITAPTLNTVGTGVLRSEAPPCEWDGAEIKGLSPGQRTEEVALPSPCLSNDHWSKLTWSRPEQCWHREELGNYKPHDNLRKVDRFLAKIMDCDWNEPSGDSSSKHDAHLHSFWQLADRWGVRVRDRSEVGPKTWLLLQDQPGLRLLPFSRKET